MKKEIAKAKKEYWNKIYKNCKINDIYKMFRRIKGKTPIPTIAKDTNNNKLTKNKEIANAICKFFSNCGRNGIHRNISIRTKSKNCILIDDMNKEITKEEIGKIMENLNVKKAFGLIILPQV